MQAKYRGRPLEPELHACPLEPQNLTSRKRVTAGAINVLSCGTRPDVSEQEAHEPDPMDSFMNIGLDHSSPRAQTPREDIRLQKVIRTPCDRNLNFSSRRTSHSDQKKNMVFGMSRREVLQDFGYVHQSICKVRQRRGSNSKERKNALCLQASRRISLYERLWWHNVNVNSVRSTATRIFQQRIFQKNKRRTLAFPPSPKITIAQSSMSKNNNALATEQNSGASQKDERVLAGAPSGKMWIVGKKGGTFRNNGRELSLGRHSVWYPKRRKIFCIGSERYSVCQTIEPENN